MKQGRVFFPVAGMAAILLLASAAVSYAAEAVHPRFASLKSDVVNMREGPSTEHRIKWVYRRAGLPVEILAEYDVWRRVRDSDGEIGWMHVALLSPERTALVTGTAVASVRRREDSTSLVLAFAEPGTTAPIEACGPIACRLDFGEIEGWIDRTRLWGVYANEHF
ncbi:MAG: hypothetical protein IID54_03920 [Proteobacteria bacterium]|nr:hypothetical protein [Pseudomonadota bacterium]